MISLNPFKLNCCDWFILAWVVYYMQGTLYPTGSVLSVGLLGINLFVSILCVLKIWKMPHTLPYIKGLNLLVIMFSIYGFSLILFNPSTIHYSMGGMDIKSFDYIKAIYLSILPIYAFYYFSLKGYLTAERLRRWALVFCISCVVSYYNEMQKSLMKLMEVGSSREEDTNNAGYLFLSLIPVWVLFHKKPLLQYIGLAFCMAFIIMGMKRGAILIGVLVVLYLVRNIIKNSKGKQRLFVISLTVGLTIIGVYLVIDMMSSSDYFLQRIEATKEGNSSGRDDLYSYFWNYFTERADFSQYLFGRGANGTLEIYHNFAHNDWLEIAVNQGLLGIVVFAIYWRRLYVTWRCSKNMEAKTILAMVGFIDFAKTFFSMSYNDMTFLSTSVFGYALATLYKPNNKIYE